ncbi:hypothetical protein BDN67DRAFT_983555 [Paxillus ammoniavirescens]|nr:hypothetical protein BDN67DRAFT_983555 [Paxillus ammoniavirescens]
MTCWASPNGIIPIFATNDQSDTADVYGGTNDEGSPAIDDVSPSEDDCFAESVVHDHSSAGCAVNQSGQAEGDHHQSNCVPHLPNNGRVTPSRDEINGTVQVEDVLAQHRQRNRAPHLPSNAHLRTIHNQQVSSRHSSSTPSIAAEEGEVSDLELPPSVPLPARPAVQSSTPPVAPVASSAMENSDPSQLQFYSPSLSITVKVFLFQMLYQWDYLNCGDVNAGIAKDLLSGGAFLKDGMDDEGHTNNLAHPALSSLIIDFFYTGANSVGNLFPEVFKNEVPCTTVALATTTLKVALDEIAARRKDVNFRNSSTPSASASTGLDVDLD